MQKVQKERHCEKESYKDMVYFWCIFCLVATSCFGSLSRCGEEAKKVDGTLGQNLLLAQVDLEPGSNSLVLKKACPKNIRKQKLSYNPVTKEMVPNHSRYQYNERDSSITILQLQRGDEGVYEVVVGTGGEEQFCKFDLKVYEQISNLLVNATHSPQNDSCVVTMNCLLRTGDSVTFSWTQDQKDLSHNSSTLVIHITPDNTNSSYTCRAKNPVSESSSRLTLSAGCSPPQVNNGENSYLVFLILTVITVIAVIAIVCIIVLCRPKVGNFLVHPVSPPKRRPLPEPLPDPSPQSINSIYASVQKREIPDNNNTTATVICPISSVYELAGPSLEMHDQRTCPTISY